MLDRVDEADEATNPRTLAMLQRLCKAMQDIEAEVAQHHGAYPFNHGRVTQSELCRRADVKKATLQTPLQNGLTISDLLGPSGGIMLKSATGATLIVNDTGIYIQNGKGASIVMTGPTVTVNSGALTIV